MESVWDYPRPPRLERTTSRVTIVHAGQIIVDSDRCWRVLETSHPPVYYVPRDDIADGTRLRGDRKSRRLLSEPGRRMPGRRRTGPAAGR